MSHLLSVYRTFNKPQVDKSVQLLVSQAEDQHKKKQIVSLKENPYKLVQQLTISNQGYCEGIAINSQSTKIVAGFWSDIYVIDFLEGFMNQNQILSGHSESVMTLYFMKKYNQFLSGTRNGELAVWSCNNITNKYYLLQMIKSAHLDVVSRVIMNKNEDLIISSSCDNTIKFWTRKNIWECSQALKNHSSGVIDICLNESCTQLVSCVRDNEIIIYSQLGNQKWKKIQRIQDRVFKVGVCFLNENQLAVQPFNESLIEIYQLNEANKQFIKHRDTLINFEDYGSIVIPMKFNINKQLLLCKNATYLNLIRKSNNDFIQEQSIKFVTIFFQGTATDDFKYLITLQEEESNKFQIRKQQ